MKRTENFNDAAREESEYFILGKQTEPRIYEVQWAKKDAIWRFVSLSSISSHLTNVL